MSLMDRSMGTSGGRSVIHTPLSRPTSALSCSSASSYSAGSSVRFVDPCPGLHTTIVADSREFVVEFISELEPLKEKEGTWQDHEIHMVHIGKRRKLKAGRTIVLYVGIRCFTANVVKYCNKSSKRSVHLVQSTPVLNAPAQKSPVEDTPPQNASAQSTLVENTPVHASNKEINPERVTVSNSRINPEPIAGGLLLHPTSPQASLSPASPRLSSGSPRYSPNPTTISPASSRPIPAGSPTYRLDIVRGFPEAMPPIGSNLSHRPTGLRAEVSPTLPEVIVTSPSAQHVTHPAGPDNGWRHPDIVESRASCSVRAGFYGTPSSLNRSSPDMQPWIPEFKDSDHLNAFQASPSLSPSDPIRSIVEEHDPLSNSPLQAPATTHNSPGGMNAIAGPSTQRHAPRFPPGLGYSHTTPHTALANRVLEIHSPIPTLPKGSARAVLEYGEIPDEYDQSDCYGGPSNLNERGEQNYASTSAIGLDGLPFTLQQSRKVPFMTPESVYLNLKKQFNAQDSPYQSYLEDEDYLHQNNHSRFSKRRICPSPREAERVHKFRYPVPSEGSLDASAHVRKMDKGKGRAEPSHWW
ncbi:hypothetical protein BDQ17DRAFT_1463381 [Cyathus striatus]|nr:hypothetical protein BDQ17DRAFT_1463381 [Cyathus striatus]